MKVQDELSVTVRNGPLPPLLGLPPVPVLIQILVQNLLPASGVWKHHHGRGRLEQQEQGHAPQPVQRYMPHPGDGDDPLKLRQGGWGETGSRPVQKDTLLRLQC